MATMKFSPLQVSTSVAFVLAAGATALWPHLPEEGRVCRPTWDTPNEYEVIGRLNRQRVIVGEMMAEDETHKAGLAVVFRKGFNSELTTMTVNKVERTCEVAYTGWSGKYNSTYPLEGPSYWAILRGLKAS